VVLVHGGGGQGTDWMETPDGTSRAGSSTWCRRDTRSTSSIALATGARRCIPDLHGGFPANHITLESLAGRFTPPSANPAQRRTSTEEPQPVARCRATWGSLDLDQLVAGLGGSYVQTPPPPGAPAARQGGAGARAGGAGGRGAAAAAAPQPANAGPAGQLNVQHLAWRQAGADLLDKIGPAIIMTHSAGGPFGLLVAEARPNLVKATVIIEGAGSGFAGGNRWGMSSVPVTYDPPVADPAEIKTTYVASPEQGIAGYFLQAEPARKLPNLKNTKVVFVTSDSSFASPGNPWRRGVPQAGGRAGRGDPARRARHQGQRPHDDGREEQPRGAAAARSTG
jgi:hypothetical protein